MRAASSMASQWQATVVRRLQRRGYGVLTMELVAAGGGTLLPFAAGAHVELLLGEHGTRSYSLINPSPAPTCYQLGILHLVHGRGGSHHLHTRVREGDIMQVSAPRNAFPLHDDAAPAVLIAGGIGITPLLGMARTLAHTGRPAHLYYAARSRAQAVYLPDAHALGLPVTALFDDERGGPPDFRTLLRAHPREAHCYCCGPPAMLAAFLEACAALGFQHAHVERFAAYAEAARSVAPRRHARIILARSGRVLDYDGQGSLLDLLLRHGSAVSHGCRQGVCGSCAVRVLGGRADHRDAVLSPHEREHGRLMLPCVSGCLDAVLELDL